jgi:putative Ig domain-containing protein
MQTNIKANIARLAGLLVLTGTLAACGGGGSDGTTGAATSADPVTTSPTTSPTTNPVQQPATNHAPTITGSAITSVSASKAYSFTPTAADADGDTLTFSIQSKPSWATFNTKTGRLSGTPTNAQVGSYEEIAISVSDGKATTQLAQFSITVEAAQAGSKSVMVSWTPPTTNSDGTSLTNLSGYRIMYGTQSGNYSQSVNVNSAGITSFTLDNLEAGKQYHVVMVSVNASGAESDVSQEVVVDLT